MADAEYSEPPEHQPAVTIPPQLAVEESVRARWELTTNAGHGFGSRVERGQVVSKKERIVREFPHLFRDVAAATNPCRFRVTGEGTHRLETEVLTPPRLSQRRKKLSRENAPRKNRGE